MHIYPARPDTPCLDCGESISYSGRGGVRKRCKDCAHLDGVRRGRIAKGLSPEPINTCPDCGVASAAPLGLRTRDSKRCEDCRKVAANQASVRSYANNIEQNRAYARKYRADHLEQSRMATREYMARLRTENPEVVNENKRRYRYGLDIGQYDQMRAAQDYRCALCHTHESELTKPLFVDHDHDCCDDKALRKFCGRCIRGLLCANCNTGIGYLRDDPNLLRAAAAYIESHIKENAA